MKHKTGRKLLSFLLTLAMLVGLVPGMGLTAYAAEATTLTAETTTWSEDCTITDNVTITGNVTVTADITLTIPEDKTLTVNGNINAEGKTVTVSGKGNLIVTGADGTSGAKGTYGTQTKDGGPGGNGTAGSAGFTGNIIVAGANVTITGGNGGNGGNGGGAESFYGGKGGNGGSGGNGVSGNVTVNSGTIKMAGGNGGAGGTGGTGFRGNGGNGSAGTAGQGVSGTLNLGAGVKLYNGTDNTGTVLDGSDSTERSYSGSRPQKMFAEYVNPHTHSFTYTADGDTITATCGAEDKEETCPLKDKNYQAKLTIAPPTAGGGAAVLTGDTDAFGVSASNIKYYTKSGSDWTGETTTPPSGNGFYKAEITVGTTYTVSVTYGVNAITTDKEYSAETYHGTVTVPSVATANATITINTTPAEGYELKTLTVTKAGGGTVTVTKDGNNGSFTMPEENVSISAEFGLIDYEITKNPMSNGSVTVKKGENEVTTANYGDTVTLVATPDDGFALSSLTVKDSSNTMSELSGTDNTRTFTMPASNVTVSATFEGAPFDVTISDTISGGTVTVASTLENGKAKAGSEVTLTVTAGTGFTLDSVTVKKASGDTVAVTDNKFIMPTEAVTVSATFVGKDTTATLAVTGNEGTTCTAELLHDDFSAVTGEKPLTKKAGEKFILLVNRDDGYDFVVTFSSGGTVSMTEFTKEEYEAYVAYAKDNNITLSSNMVLAWVTMPGVADDSVTLTVDFSKLQTFTVLYQPIDSGTTAVWCKFAKTEGGNTETASSQMKSDATMGDGSQVYSLKVTVGFAPTSVAFATTKDDVDAIADDSMTNCSTKTGTSESDWTDISSGKFCVIGGNAKTAIVAFVSDASNMAVYNSDTVEVDEGKGTDGVTYRVAIVTDGSAGTVKAPANTLTKEGYDFAGWRGFEGTAPHKTEKIYNAGDSISVSENTTLNAVWNLKKSTVTLNLNGGTGNSSIDPVTYGEKLPTLENPTRSGFAFDGWKVSKAVTENGVAFAKGSPFDLDTPITADLQLEAQWKHVHSYTCYRISTFGDALAAYAEYDSAIHVAVCGCNDIQLMAHEFDENGKCACGYQKPGASDVTLNISYGQWSNGAYTEKMKGMPETAKQGQEVSICAPDAWGDLQFSKWQYSTDNSTWYDLTADAYASFLIPATMYVRALYVNPVTVPQVDLSARQYDDHTVVNGKTYTMDNILFQMNYKLPDDYTFVDAGIRLGDNAGISYYELKERTYTADSETKGWIKGFAALGVLVSVDPTNASAASIAGSSETKTFYEVHKNSVLDEMTAAELAKHMYESKPINVEKYDPIYWEAKAKTKGMSGSMATLPPLRFAQKDNQDHWIYGIGWLRYKDKAGNIQTIYTDALAATVNGVLKSNTGTVTKTGN